MARVLVAEHLHAVGHGVLAAAARDLVDQRFHDEGRVGRSHAAPPQHGHVDLGVVHGQAHGQRIGLAHALHGRGVDAVLDHAALEHGARRDGLAHDGVVPGQHLAAFVEADPGAVQVHGAVVAALDVVLAAPDHAHGSVQAGAARGQRHLAGLDHIVAGAHAPAAKAAAGHLHVHAHLLGLEAQHARGGHAVHARELRAQVEVGTRLAGLAHLHRAVERLHGRMGQVGEAELGLDMARRLVQRRDIGVEVARAGLRGQLAVLGQLAFAVHLLHGVGVPLRLQRFAALARWPVAGGDHGHAFAATVHGHAQHGLDAGHGTRRSVVQRGQLCLEHGRVCNHRRQLARQVHVDAEALLAAALGPGVDAARGLADQAEVLGILQHDGGRHGLGHGGLGQLAIRQLLAVGAEHEALARAQRGGVHLPLRGGGGHQHGARTGAQLAVLGVAVLEGGGAARHLDAVARIGIGRIVAAQAGADLAPVGVQLLGQHQGQGGVHALAEFQAVDGHGDFAAGRDLHEGGGLLGGLEAGGLALARRLRHGGKHAQGQRTGTGDLEEAAAGDLCKGGRVGDGSSGLVTVQDVLQGARQFGGVEGGQHAAFSVQPRVRAASATAARMRA